MVGLHPDQLNQNGAFESSKVIPKGIQGWELLVLLNLLLLLESSTVCVSPTGTKFSPSTGWHMLGKSFHSETFVYLHGVRQAKHPSLVKHLGHWECQYHLMTVSISWGFTKPSRILDAAYERIQGRVPCFRERNKAGAGSAVVQCAASAIASQSGDQDDDGSSEDTMSYTRRSVLS